MRRYQEAFYEIEQELYFDCGIGMDGYNKEKELKLLQELVDKETPMKIALGSEKDSPRCPNCDRWFPNRQDYCSKCGQKLDWGEEE